MIVTTTEQLRRLVDTYSRYDTLFLDVETVHDPAEQQLALRLQGPSLAHWFGLDELGRDILTRVLYGARISLLVGIVVVGVSASVGILMGAYKPIEAFLEPFVSFARYLPASAFIPLLILWAGRGELQKLLVIYIGSVFQIVLMVAVTVSSVRRDLVDAAMTLGARDRGILARVLIPASAPDIAEILRLVLGWAWTYVIVAELIGSSSEIGHMIIDSQALLATGQIIFGIIVIGVIGLISDFLFKWGNRRLFPWSLA